MERPNLLYHNEVAQNYHNEVAQNVDNPRSSGQPQRQKSVAWTEEEHQLFLMGLNKFGKGDWKNISRYYVITKTPTQVASHAQKFYRRRLNSTPLNKRRPSIHDIQTVNPIPSTVNSASGSVTHRPPNITGLMAANNRLHDVPAIPSFTSSFAQNPILNSNFHVASPINPNPRFLSMPSSSSSAFPSAASFNNYPNTSLQGPSAASNWFMSYGNNHHCG